MHPTDDIAMASIIFQEQLEVPGDIESLADFRRWAISDRFPERGRIDYISGHIEVDMSPESLYMHSGVKVELVRVLAQLTREQDSGELHSDRVRISSVPADLSAEPDVIFLSHDSIDSGRVQFVEKAGRADDAIEIEGGPDLVVEIVSDSSAGKDTKRLPAAYFNAGVQEFWLIDARRDDLAFHIHHRGSSSFEPVAVDEGEYQQSEVFSCRFRLTRKRNRRGRWTYNLET